MKTNITVKLTPEGAVLTIPLKLANQLNWQEGSILEVETSEDGERIPVEVTGAEHITGLFIIQKEKENAKLG